MLLWGLIRIKYVNSIFIRVKIRLKHSKTWTHLPIRNSTFQVMLIIHWMPFMPNRPINAKLVSLIDRFTYFLSFILIFLWILEDLRAFIKQLRIETGLRVCNKVYEEHGDKPSKVCNVNVNIFFYLLIFKHF